MPERHVNIGLDFDDTLMQTRQALLAYLNAQYGTQRTLDELTMCRFTALWGLDDRQFDDLFDRRQEEFHQAPPFPAALECLRSWAVDSRFFIITCRPPAWVPCAAAWLARHGIPAAEITSAEDAAAKARHAAEKGITLFVDDQPEPALKIAEQGIEVLLLDAPYNQGCSHPHIRRVRDWHEIQALVP